jgi:ABC-type Zn uptake system ZnuABC Zn-binding protein ZnuA
MNNSPTNGDPLLNRRGTPTNQPTASARGPRRGQPGGFGRGPRLLLAIGVAVTAVVIFSRMGGASEDTESSATIVEGTAKKQVLVSDPANTAIVREIAGDLVNVDSIVPPGANGHTYEPVPDDAKKVLAADLYFDNGMDLNTAVTNFVRTNYRVGTVEVILSSAVPPAEMISTDTAEQIASHGHAHAFNAHFWTDPIYAAAYAGKIAEALANLDPPNAATYESRADAFVSRMQELDRVFRDAIASIPPQNRKLVVYHDSWSYFGRRYGIPIVGAIQPVSFAEPSADEVRRMIDQIRAEAVPAFFGSEVFPSDVLDAIASETGSTYFADLSDEELPGEPGSPEHTYEGMMIKNVRLITTALGGNVSLLDSLTTSS